MKTTMATITAHIASVAHGIGTDTITLITSHWASVHIGVHGDLGHIGTDGDTATGAATDILTLGTMTHGITEDGIMEDGIAHITTITSTMDGTTHTTTIMDMAQVI